MTKTSQAKSVNMHDHKLMEAYLDAFLVAEVSTQTIDGNVYLQKLIRHILFIKM